MTLALPVRRACCCKRCLSPRSARWQLAYGNEHRSLGLRSLLDDLELPRLPVIGMRERQPSRGLVPQLLLIGKPRRNPRVLGEDLAAHHTDRQDNCGKLHHLAHRASPLAHHGRHGSL